MLEVTRDYNVFVTVTMTVSVPVTVTNSFRTQEEADDYDNWEEEAETNIGREEIWEALVEKVENNNHRAMDEISDRSAEYEQEYVSGEEEPDDEDDDDDDEEDEEDDEPAQTPFNPEPGTIASLCPPWAKGDEGV